MTARGDDFRCDCGNDSRSDGFYPCDADGNEIEPVLGAPWYGLYRCDRCDAVLPGHVFEADRVEMPKVYRLRFEYSIEVTASSFEQVTAAALAELATLADGDTVAEWAGWELVEAEPAQCVECDAPLDEYACPTCSPLDVVCVECCDCPPDLYKINFD